MSSELNVVQVNQLIADKRYEEAKAILREATDSYAKSWLANLERQFPTPSARPSGSTMSSSVPSRLLYVSPYYKERGVWLTVWLVFASVVNPLAGLFLIFRAGSLSSQLSILALLEVCINIVCLYGIWNWKKWGVYGYFGLTLLSDIVSLPTLLSGTLVVGAIVGIVILVIVGFLIGDRWQMFD